MQLLKIRTLQNLNILTQQLEYLSDINFSDSILNDLKTYTDKKFLNMNLVEISENFSFDYIEFSADDKYTQKALAISIIVLLTCTSYNDILLDHIFQYLINQGKDFGTGFIICWLAKSLFPNFSDEISEKFNKYFKK